MSLWYHLDEWRSQAQTYQEKESMDRLKTRGYPAKGQIIPDRLISFPGLPSIILNWSCLTWSCRLFVFRALLTLILGSLITFSKHPQKTDTTTTKRASSIAVLSGGRLIKFLPVVDGWLVGGWIRQHSGGKLKLKLYVCVRHFDTLWHTVCVRQLVCDTLCTTV